MPHMGRNTFFAGVAVLALFASMSGCRGLLVLNENSYFGQPCELPSECGAAGTCVSNICVRVTTGGTWCNCSPS